MTNYLITGGLGFIGSNLAIRLASCGHNVSVVDSLIPEYGGNMFNISPESTNINVNISDIRDPYSLHYLLKGIDIVFNLAGQTSHADSMSNPFIDLDINAKAQLSLLEGVRTVCPEAKIIYASTRQIYGKPQYLPVDESHPLRPVDVNGVNKQAGESFHLLYYDVYGIKTSVLRLTNTYGPRMRIKDARQTFLGVWIRNILTSRPVDIFGDGTQLRDFNFVDDVVDALILASETDTCVGKVVNLGSPDYISLLNLATQLTSYVPRSSYRLVPFPPERKAIDIGDYYSDPTLALDLLNWSPKTSIHDGLPQTLNYFQQHLSYYL